MKQMNSKKGLLRKWILGAIGAKEEIHLDRLSHDDPFLADAMEGYRSAPTHDHQQALSRLQNKVRQQTEEKSKRIFPLPIRSIAAIGLLLLGMTAIWRWSLYQTSNETLATLPQEISEIRPTDEQAIAESTSPDLDTEADPSPTNLEESLPPPPVPEPATKRNAPSTQAAPAAPPAPPLVEEDIGMIEAEITEEIAFDTKAAQPVEYLNRSKEAKAIPAQPATDAAFEEAISAMKKTKFNSLEDESENPFIELGVSYFEIAQDQNDSLFALAHFETHTDTVLSYYTDNNFYIDFRPNSDGTKNQYLSRNLDQTKPNTKEEYDVLKDYFGFRNKEKDQAEFFRSGRNVVEPPIFAPTIAYSIWPDGQPQALEVVKTATPTYDRMAINMVQKGPKWVLPKGLDSLQTRIIIPLEQQN